MHIILHVKDFNQILIEKKTFQWMKQVTKFNISYENKSQVNRTHGTGRASVYVSVRYPSFFLDGKWA